jgi:hypothetical protein
MSPELEPTMSEAAIAAGKGRAIKDEVNDKNGIKMTKTNTITICQDESNQNECRLKNAGKGRAIKDEVNDKIAINMTKTNTITICQDESNQNECRLKNEVIDTNAIRMTKTVRYNTTYFCGKRSLSGVSPLQFGSNFAIEFFRQKDPLCRKVLFACTLKKEAAGSSLTRRPSTTPPRRSTSATLKITEPASKSWS